MQTHKLVMPEHLNHYGFLFGGYLLQWVDENAWIAARLDYPKFNFVTVAMDRVEFHRSVRQGTILTFEVLKVRVGNTSVDYQVQVRRWNEDLQIDESVFATKVTMVRVDENGQKQPLSAP
jgi:acyl-CoA hydrolase